MTYAEPMQPFVSARGRATAITVLTILQLVALALSTIGYAIALGGHELGGPVGLVFGGALDILDSALFLATLVVFMTWVYRSIANLPALGSMSCRFTPSGAVWSFFIPFVNLVRGHQVMATIWQESQPPAFNEHGYYLPRKTTIVNWWWALIILIRVASWITSRTTPIDADEVRELVISGIVLNLMYMAAGALFLVMIRGAQARQDEQWQDLERRRNVPQPRADALR